MQMRTREISGNVLVMWDGATMHHDPAGKDFLAKGGATRRHLERLPADAPALKPHEGVWNLLTRVERKHVCGRDVPHVQREVRRATERVRHRTSIRCQCFAHAGCVL